VSHLEHSGILIVAVIGLVTLSGSCMWREMAQIISLTFCHFTPSFFVKEVQYHQMVFYSAQCQPTIFWKCINSLYDGTYHLTHDLEWISMDPLLGRCICFLAVLIFLYLHAKGYLWIQHHEKPCLFRCGHFLKSNMMQASWVVSIGHKLEKYQDAPELQPGDCIIEGTVYFWTGLGLAHGSWNHHFDSYYFNAFKVS
jgi:hypothetical protein